MQARSIVPAMLAVLAAIASAQNTAPIPEADAAHPAPTADAGTEPAAAVAAVTAASAAKPAPQQRCHKEYPLGSNVPKTVCETPVDPDLDQMRIRALDDLKNAVRPGLRVIGG